ncbi:hypothetical protein RhiirA5_434489 [Rhizophagus irregularis]|uniref:Uncharacterized protein n=1 Tax=Rhizophagus irregularis TaxID=588596 RepID=A0A2N0NNV3_9GLOM|nr:hypothetical protein RhiirA5_435156 [Rhizophagus irregularis]PKB96648.1 hypothetical protein RhiirA5_434489 [Rhizophagus irregularis]
MHSYNPLEKADTIAIIIQKLPLEVLDKLCWINSTWYKEIQHEFWRRWKIQVLEYYKLGHEEEKLEYPFNWDVVSEEFIERETEIAKKQIAKNVVPWWDVDKWEESEFLGFIKKDTYGGFAPKEYNRPFGFGIKQFINKILYYDDEMLYFVEDNPI